MSTQEDQKEKLTEEKTEKTKITDEEILEAAKENLVATFRGGQSYKIGSRSLIRPNLTETKNTIANFEAKIAVEESGPLLGGAYVAVFDGR